MAAFSYNETCDATTGSILIRANLVVDGTAIYPIDFRDTACYSNYPSYYREESEVFFAHGRRFPSLKEAKHYVNLIKSREIANNIEHTFKDKRSLIMQPAYRMTNYLSVKQKRYQKRKTTKERLGLKH